MPRCFDDPFPVYLDSDAEKPEESRPTFYFRTLSLREWRAAKSTEGTTAADQAEAIVKASFVRCEHCGDEKWDATNLDDLLHPGEFVELLGKLQLGYSDKKKLESQP